MQKQSKRIYQIVFSPMPLPDEFPILAYFHARQGDKPITWLHSHDCLEIGYCYEGDGIFVVGDKVLPFRAGDVSFIAPDELHLAQSAPGTLSRWAWLYVEPFQLLKLAGKEVALLATTHLTGKHFCNMISPQHDAFIGPLVKELFAEMEHRASGYETSVRGMVASLMARLQRLPRKRVAVSRTRRKPALRRIAPSLDFMANRYAQPADVGAWARECRTSVPHFRRLFRTALGKSPHQYLIELRVLMAASRLRVSEDKIVTIAHEVGFSTLSSFNRSFRRIMRLAPRDWKRRG